MSLVLIRLVPRPKHVPEVKTQDQLFDERCHISKGPLFEENFGVLHDQDIRIAGGKGQTPWNATYEQHEKDRKERSTKIEPISELSDSFSGFEENRKKVPRPKHVPEVKTQDQLFDERCHISKGPLFEENFGVLHDQDIRIAGGKGQTPRNATSFDDCGLDVTILRNIRRRNYSHPTQVQKAVIPLIQNTDCDLMAHAHTGTGKSAAFLLPLVNEIQQMRNAGSAHHNGDSPYSIVIAPTRELVKQLYEDACTFSTGTSVDVALAYGDIPMGVSINQLRKGCDLVVSTVGRLFHYVREGIIKLGKLRFFVLDETDKFFAYEDAKIALREVFKEIKRLGSRHRTLMFSATFDSEVQEIANEFLKECFFFVSVGDGLTEAAAQVLLDHGGVSPSPLKMALIHVPEQAQLIADRKSGLRAAAPPPLLPLVSNWRPVGPGCVRRLLPDSRDHFICYDAIRHRSVPGVAIRVGDCENRKKVPRPKHVPEGRYSRRTSACFMTRTFELPGAKDKRLGTRRTNNSHQIIPDWLELIVRNNHMIRLDAEQQQRITQDNGFGEGDAVVNWDDDMNL
uniref:RNA helicase n=1 Tax=Globodera pallida TaxID=36090 RepID=A0A183BLN5_GLOPA